MTDAGQENHDGPSGESREEPAAVEDPAPRPPSAEKPAVAQPDARRTRPVEPQAADAWDPGPVSAEQDPTSTDPVIADVVARWGPEALEEDSWDDVPRVTTNRAYAGRRRAEPPRTRRWVLVGAIVVGLGVIAALPYLLTASPDPGSAASTPATSYPTSRPTSPGEAMSVSSSPTPAPTATATSAPPSTTTQPARSATSANPPPPFEPVTLEAETGELSGSAEVEPYAGSSGGRIVMRIGEWGRRADGVLTLRDIVIPAGGRYSIAIYYVHPNNDQTRHARIGLTDHEPIMVTFEGDSVCCRTKVLTVDLTAGIKALRIEASTPDEQAPSVDKIVISRA